MIPTSTPAGWTINPADGAEHAIYGCVVSQFGNGCLNIIDGNGIKFQVKSGNFDRNINVETSVIPLRPSQLAILANPGDPLSVGTSSGNPVCNGTSPPTRLGTTTIYDNGWVGGYLSHRGLSCSQVFETNSWTVSTAKNGQTIPLATYVSSVAPAVSAIHSSGVFQAIAIGWLHSSSTSGIYARNGTVVTGGMIATSSLIATNGTTIPSGTACVDPGPTYPYFSYGPDNPLYNSTLNATQYLSAGFLPTMYLGALACPTCTSASPGGVNGVQGTTGNATAAWVPDVPTFLARVDQAIAAENTNPSKGVAYYKYTPYGNQEWPTANGIGNGYFSSAAGRLANTVELSTRTANAGSTLVAESNILAYGNDAANHGFGGSTFISGAGFGWSGNSSSGQLPFDGSQTSIASWITAGAVASAGAAVEPCTNIFSRYPDTEIYLRNITQGQRMIEAAWKSVDQHWKTAMVGDPLAAPFSSGLATTPVLTSSSLTSLKQSSSAMVTLTGRNFTSPATVNWPATGGSVTNVTVVSATNLTATFTAAPNAIPGSYNVTVGTAAGTSGSVPFQITAPTPAPVLTSLLPSNGNPSASVTVTLTGSNFAQGAAVNITGLGVTASNVSVIGATSLTATFTIAGNAAPGSYNVTVTTSAGTSNAVAFTVNPLPAGPVLSYLSPASGTVGSTLNVSLSGTGFTPGATVSLIGTGVSASNISVVSTTQITATFTIAGTAPAGAHNVMVITSSGTSNAAAFTVNPVAAAPVLSSLSPASATVGSSLNVSLSGTGFTPGATVSLSGTGVSASNISVVSATQITATFTIAGTAPAGAHNVMVITSSGTSNAAAFTVNPVAAAGPTLTAITPNSGNAGTSVNLTLTGTNFTPSTGVRLAGLGAAVRNLVFVSPTQINVTFVLNATTAKGAHNVYVTNSSGNSVILPFTVN